MHYEPLEIAVAADDVSVIDGAVDELDDVDSRSTTAAAI